MPARYPPLQLSLTMMARATEPRTVFHSGELHEFTESCRAWRGCRRLPVAGLPSVLAAAGDTEAGLRAQVQQQAKQLREQASLLEQLSARLAALEGTAQSTGAAPSSGAGVDAQLAAAIADTRQDDMAILQAQVAQLAATGGGGWQCALAQGRP